ncbi:mitofilin family membrane protein [Azospirillum sp. SYSU D00513]|uniref:mitofilin family membrane protein n=1 Tax=Azospirillum sp. SYSU D00513 TaxID=2812561 RepID=UPI001A977EAA|nr:mitofilin family membrane protein [Azospirillum sp. SYSU D00513]
MTSRQGPDNESTPNGQTPSDQTPNSGSNASGHAAVERIIERFGGIRPMASKLDIPVTTVQGWKKRGAIPVARHADLRTAATRHKLLLDDADLTAATPADEQGADTLFGDTPGSDTIMGNTVISPADVVATPESGSADTITGATGGPAGSGADMIGTGESTAESTAATAGTTAARSYDPPASVAKHRPEPRRSGSGFATAVSLLALIVGGAALSEPWWGPRVPGWPHAGQTQTATAQPAPAQTDPAVADQIRQLNERIAQLEQRPVPAPAAGGDAASTVPAVDTQALTGRIDALEQRLASVGSGDTAAAPAQPAPPPVDIAPLEQSLAQLTSRLDGLEQRGSQQSEQQQRVAELTQRLSGLEQQLSQVGQNASAAQGLQQEVGTLKEQLASVNKTVEERSNSAAAAQAMVLAAGQLRNTLAAGQPFQSDLQAVRSLGIGDPQITQPLDTLAPYAAKGIPTEPQLAERFEPLAAEIVRADDKGDPRDWLDQVKGTLATLVTVRQEGGGVVGTSTGAIVARAEAAIQKGDIPGAVQELSGLQGPAAAAAAPWLEDAKARLAANQATRQLSSRAIALMGNAAGATSGNGAAQ